MPRATTGSSHQMPNRVIGEQPGEDSDGQVGADQVLPSFTGGGGRGELFAEAEFRSPQQGQMHSVAIERPMPSTVVSA